MGGYFGHAGVYLIQVLFGLYILAVMLRFLFQLVRADFYNPISQVIVKVTNPPLLPLRRLIPGLYGIDLASVVLLFVLQALELYLIIGLQRGFQMGLAGVSIMAVAQLIELAVYIMIFAIFIRIIISWINPMSAYNPAMSLLTSLTEPLMRPARRLIPPISGLDLSPIAVFVVLQLFIILFVNPLEYFGRSLL